MWPCPLSYCRCYGQPRQPEPKGALGALRHGATNDRRIPDCRTPTRIDSAGAAGKTGRPLLRGSPTHRAAAAIASPALGASRSSRSRHAGGNPGNHGVPADLPVRMAGRNAALRDTAAATSACRRRPSPGRVRCDPTAHRARAARLRMAGRRRRPHRCDGHPGLRSERLARPAIRPAAAAPPLASPETIGRHEPGRAARGRVLLEDERSGGWDGGRSDRVSHSA